MKFIIQKGEIRQVDDKNKFSGEIYKTNYQDDEAYIWSEKLGEYTEKNKTAGTIEILNEDYGQAKYLLQDALFGSYWDFKKIIVAGIMLIMFLGLGFILGGIGKISQSQLTTIVEQEKQNMIANVPAVLLQEENMSLKTENEELKTKLDLQQVECQKQVEDTQIESLDKIKQAENQALYNTQTLQECIMEKNNEIMKYNSLNSQLELEKVEKQTLITENNGLLLELKAEKEKGEFERYVGKEIIGNCETNQTQLCKNLFFKYSVYGK